MNFDRNLTRLLGLKEILVLYGQLFQYPQEDLFADIANGKLDQELTRLGKIAGHSRLTNMRSHVSTYDALVNDFNEYLLGLKQPFAPPVESVYKAWTTDPSYDGPYKNQKGYLMGDPALHIKHIAEALGIEIPREYQMMPDHLTILLELYGHLLEQELLVEAEQFRQDHFDWLEDYHLALTKLAGNCFYSYALETMMALLEANPLEIN